MMRACRSVTRALEPRRTESRKTTARENGRTYMETGDAQASARVASARGRTQSENQAK
jgi:hypothetical protein